jgi:(E)-4-hydroxy-3-methylbut-2-enyl-diphosphate synthase
MFDEFGECYPLHLGVTEAGDGEMEELKAPLVSDTFGRWPW